MADRSVLRQVDGGNLMRAEVDAVVTVRPARPDRHAFAKERLSDRPLSSLEADIGPFAADLSDDLAWLVLRLGEPLRHRPGADPIATGGHLIVQRLVRPIEVVDVAPLIERSLNLGEIAEPAHREHFRL